jgi:prolyl oligopeptidase PreP (S9A serine peptidase family)
MNKDLEQLIDDAVAKENQLQAMSDSLALQSKQFADYLEAKRTADKELEVLWDMVKEYMVENNIKEHETDFISLKLTPSGKYRAEDISTVADELCDIKKVLNNKKVKAYLELNHELPDGVESTGYVLRKKVKEEE